MKLPASKKGFTLIELMIVMAVMAILATMVLFGLSKAQASARDSARQQIMTGVQTGLERFYGDYQAYPSTTTVPAAASNSFCGAVSQLVALNYIPAPNDPKTKAAICGANNPTIGGATYTYLAANPAQTYVLTLTKESGGSSVFNSPQ